LLSSSYEAANSVLLDCAIFAALLTLTTASQDSEICIWRPWICCHSKKKLDSMLSHFHIMSTVLIPLL